ncbi:MAG: class I SAM-dependent methyltransferase [Chitinispirillaceae bacterium]|nr:class I SAM-dependent methyltransferase [Chitinispirillaceae bacterium]
MVYDALAPLYDRIMSHVDYDEWVRLIGRVVKKHRPGRDLSVLEIGGGTGVLATRLNDIPGLTVTGSDLSFSMCQRAHARHSPFFCADARAMPCKPVFDLALFLYDGINYLSSLGDYTTLFAEAASCLLPGGLFLFDITTETNSLHHFRHYLESEDFGDSMYVRRSWYDKGESIQHNHFTIFRTVDGSACYEKHIEEHSQKIFGANEIARAVPEALFSVSGIWDGFSMRPYRPHSERIHFLLKKHVS